VAESCARFSCQACNLFTTLDHSFAHARCSDLTKNPSDYFSAGLVREDNIYEWEMMVVGPPETL
jgi:hypothetical protein